MKKHRGDKLSKFEVALEKGDYRLPRDLPAPDDFGDLILAMITMFQRVGCPSHKTMMKLCVWKALQKDVKATAGEFFDSPEALYQLIQRMKQHYLRSLNPKRPKKTA